MAPAKKKAASKAASKKAATASNKAASKGQTREQVVYLADFLKLVEQVQKAGRYELFLAAAAQDKMLIKGTKKTVQGVRSFLDAHPECRAPASRMLAGSGRRGDRCCWKT